MARSRTPTLPGAAMADPKQQQRPRLHLPEMEDLLHGVRVDLARLPSGDPLTPLLLVQGLGFAKISRFRVSTSDAVARRKTSPSILVKLGDSVADQRCRLCFPQTTATTKNHVLWCCGIRTLTIGLSCVGPTWCRLLKFCSLINLVHQEQE
jgi:hypothetical protein